MRKLIAGNWKMHHGPDASRRFIAELEVPADGDAGLILFPPAISLLAAREALSARPELVVRLGIQNIHAESSGAFTGEIAAEMAAGAGAELVLVGHSERRHIFGEADFETRMKVEAALRAGLTPLLCVGETLDERREGRLQEVLDRQLRAVLAGGDLADRLAESGLILAYEPVWAIGTGETATPADASEAHGFLRGLLDAGVGSEAAAATPILYGGSVKPDNAAALLAAPEVDGVLIGGASLEPASFSAIAAAAG